MPTILTFAKIAKIKGVKSFILVRKDGQVMTHNVEDPRSTSSLILQSGLNSDAARAIMGLSEFSHMMVEREKGEHLHLFSVAPYYIGVFQDPDLNTEVFVAAILKFIDGIMNRPEKKETSLKTEGGRVTFVTKLD